MCIRDRHSFLVVLRTFWNKARIHTCNICKKKMRHHDQARGKSKTTSYKISCWQWAELSCTVWKNRKAKAILLWRGWFINNCESGFWMLKRKIRIIEDFLGSYFKSKNEFLFYCPKCKHHKPKFSVNFDKNVFKCWVCDYNGRNISHLVSSYGKPKNNSEWKSVCGTVDMSEPVSYTHLTLPTTPDV